MYCIWIVVNVVTFFTTFWLSFHIKMAFWIAENQAFQKHPPRWWNFKISVFIWTRKMYVFDKLDITCCESVHVHCSFAFVIDFHCVTLFIIAVRLTCYFENCAVTFANVFAIWFWFIITPAWWSVRTWYMLYCS